MKRFALLLMIQVLAGSLSFGQTKEEGQVINLCRQKFQWMIHDRVDSLAMILDDRLQFIHSTGWIETRQDLLEDIKSGKLNYQKIELSDLKARIYGNTAVVTGTGVFSGTNTSEPFIVHLLFTEVYVLKGKAWILITRHANKMT